MAKLLELSILFALIAIPAMAAKDPSPARGLRGALVKAFWFNAVYLLLMMFVYGRLAS
jgi:hypothetical protein